MRFLSLLLILSLSFCKKKKNQAQEDEIINPDKNVLSRNLEGRDLKEVEDLAKRSEEDLLKDDGGFLPIPEDPNEPLPPVLMTLSEKALQTFARIDQEETGTAFLGQVLVKFGYGPQDDRAINYIEDADPNGNQNEATDVMSPAYVFYLNEHMKAALQGRKSDLMFLGCSKGDLWKKNKKTGFLDLNREDKTSSCENLVLNTDPDQLLLLNYFILKDARGEQFQGVAVRSWKGNSYAIFTYHRPLRDLAFILAFSVPTLDYFNFSKGVLPVHLQLYPNFVQTSRGFTPEEGAMLQKFFKIIAPPRHLTEMSKLWWMATLQIQATQRVMRTIFTLLEVTQLMYLRQSLRTLKPSILYASHVGSKGGSLLNRWWPSLKVVWETLAVTVGISGSINRLVLSDQLMTLPDSPFRDSVFALSGFISHFAFIDLLDFVLLGGVAIFSTKSLIKVALATDADRRLAGATNSLFSQYEKILKNRKVADLGGDLKKARRAFNDVLRDPQVLDVLIKIKKEAPEAYLAKEVTLRKANPPKWNPIGWFVKGLQEKVARGGKFQEEITSLLENDLMGAMQEAFKKRGVNMDEAFELMQVPPN